LYDANEVEVSKRWTFEENIKRPYFHVKPLEKVQLRNWRDYLDFEIGTGNHHRVVLLYERCMIACALYEEFWQRFASYMDLYDCVEGCQSVYHRACRIHLPKKPDIHLAWAAFEEKHGKSHFYGLGILLTNVCRIETFHPCFNVKWQPS
jgi:pre-mRNA-processing factor 39